MSERTSGFLNGPGQVWDVPVWGYAHLPGSFIIEDSSARNPEER